MTDTLSAIAGLLASVQSLAVRATETTSLEGLLRVVTRTASLRSELDELLASLVDQARQDGATWQAVGDALGISRQAAFQRFGHPVDPRTGELMDTRAQDGAVEIAAEIVSDLAGARWTEVVARFDERMAAALDVAGVGDAWAQVVGTVGEFEGAGVPEARRLGDVTVVDTPLRFEAGEMVARISVRADRTVAGLFILAPGALQ
jgi:hypothetical protein